MGLLDFIRGVTNELRPNVPGEYINALTSSVLNRTPEDMWRTQPALRSVVSFRARNVAQLGLHTFQRVGESRERVRDNPVAQLLRRPNAHQTTFELVYDLVAMLDLYDRAYWALGPDDDAPSGWSIRSVPAPWVVGKEGGDFWGPEKWVIRPPGEQEFKVPAEAMITFVGWSPLSRTTGTPPIEALKQTLAEQISAQEFRLQMWKRGGRVGTYLTRPASATKWDPVARNRFVESFKEFTASGSKAGGTPLLEDGIEMKRVGFTAREEEYIESAKLAISTVASVYHVNPTMIGQLDNANFSNVREFRRMLYTETLGPLIAQIEDRLNAFLVPQLTDDDGVYVEFNINEKLQGSFEEQAAVLSTSVGRPWMTADEARARNNMTALGGDAAELVTPLNVLVGGQASPQDGGDPIGTLAAMASLLQLRSQRAPDAKDRRPLQLKKRATPKQVDEVAAVFAAFFERQKRVVLSALGAKADGEWWDEDRWDDELSADLLAASTPLTVATAKKTLEQVGLDPDGYDAARTANYLKAVAKNTAVAVNRATKGQLDEALDGDDPSEALSNVFDVASESRAAQAGMTLATGLASFATVEAVTQSGNGESATKTWIVTSSNPRPAHASMNGETVALSDSFSNGANWPGDASALDVDDLAGCTCDVSISIP